MNDSPPESSGAADALLDAQGLEAYREAMAASSQLVLDQWRQLERPCTGISPQELAPLIAAIDLQRPLDSIPAALEEAARLYLRDAVYFHHPHYMAHLNCPVLVAAVAAETMISAVNTSMDTWDQSVGAGLIEQRLMDWTAARCGLDTRLADGVMTSGGTQSNLMAMLLARDIAAEHIDGHSVRRQGLPASFRRMKILTSDTAHFSLHKAAAVLGLGEQAIIEIATDEHGCMLSDAAEQAIVACRREGDIPIVLAATAGTTDFGSIDPLPALAAICQRHQLRLHLDAAYGSGLLISSRHRQRLNGIEQADSITVDYHKAWFQPVSCSALVVRDRGDWRHLTYHADYLNPEDQDPSGRPNLINKSLQTTRRFDAFKLWISLRSAGAEALGDMFDAVIALAEEAYQWLSRQPDIELASTRPSLLSTLLFRYRPPALVDEAAIERLNKALRESLLTSGQAVIGGTRRRQRYYLKLTLLNPHTRLSDLQSMLLGIRQQAAQLLSDHPPLRRECSQP
ncbi:pyridoxal phosphate-dependent decarboxylase family protein [Frateuria aurantia]